MSTRAELRMGGTRLAVADVERSLAFYCSLLGLEAREYWEELIILSDNPRKVAFSPFHDHLLTPALRGHADFCRFAFTFPRRQDLARVVRRLIDDAQGIEGAACDDRVEAVYLRDPDGILIELCIERRPALGQRAGIHPLDLEGLLKELL